MMSVAAAKEQLAMAIATPIATLRSPLFDAYDPCSITWSSPTEAAMSDALRLVSPITNAAIDLLLSVVPVGSIDLRLLAAKVALASTGNPIPLADFIRVLTNTVTSLLDIIRTITEFVATIGTKVSQLASNPLAAIGGIIEWLNGLIESAVSPVGRLIAGIVNYLKPPMASILEVIRLVNYYMSLDPIAYGTSWIASQVESLIATVATMGAGVLNKLMDMFLTMVVPVALIKDLIKYCIDNVTLPIPTLQMVITLIGNRLGAFLNMSEITGALAIAANVPCVLSLATMQMAQVSMLIPNLIMNLAQVMFTIPFFLLGLPDV